MAYGVGQGFAQGVQNMQGMILPILMQKQQQKLYRDRLAFGMGWDDVGDDDGGRDTSGMSGRMATASGPVTGVRTDGSGTPYQTTRDADPSSFMGRMFQRRSGPEYATPNAIPPTSAGALVRAQQSTVPVMPSPLQPQAQPMMVRPPIVKQPRSFGEPMYRQPYLRMDEDVPTESRMRRTLGITRY
ncbi:hypothetical protein [Nitrospira sp. BLG_1]|uniref:hypothetical protein n=1 Tax=Nitrospira sp. BLG_1 TaxID=3395883 RepID=UPI0039BD6672